MLRVRANLTGASTGGGVSTMYFNAPGGESTTTAQAASDQFRALWVALGPYVPTALTITMDSVVEVVTEATGQVTDELAVTPGAVITGTGAGAYAAGVGARLRWRTNGFRNGRRKVGTTYVVPTVSSAYETNGTLVSGMLTAFVTAGNAFLTNADAAGVDPIIYSRPNDALALAGDYDSITSVTAPDQVSWLTTRRS